MKIVKYIIIMIFLGFGSCKKAIEPLDFKSNPIDPESGIVLKYVEIDAIVRYPSSSVPHSKVYFHVNTDQLPKNFGTPEIIEIYYNGNYVAYRVFGSSGGNYVFVDYNEPNYSEYGFIIVDKDKKRTDMIIPEKP